MNAPFSQGWWAIADGGYLLLETSEIPPLDEERFRGDFHWLPRLSRSEYKEADLHEELASLQRQTLALGGSLPEPFVLFMGARALREAIFSCTACYWDLSTEPVLVVPGKGIHAIRFLNDQQGCLFWYLLLGPGVHGQILCSPRCFDSPGQHGNRDELDEQTCLCAPHFEHFVYRFWMENEIWSTLHEKRTPSPEQAAYLAFHGNPSTRGWPRRDDHDPA